RAVVRTEGCTARDIIKELAFNPVDDTLHAARAVTRRESPTVLAVASEIQRIADCVFPMGEGRSPAVLEVVAVALAHEFVANPTEIDPQVGELMREERTRIQQFAIVDSLP